MHTYARWLTALAALLYLAASATFAQGGKPLVIEAEKHVSRHARVYRDEKASGKAVAVLALDQASDGSLLAFNMDLPPGEYVATFWLQAVPVATIHSLEVRLTANQSQRKVEPINFDARPVYQPMRLQFTHVGGRFTASVSAAGETGFNGMRPDNSEDEKASQIKIDDSHLLASNDDEFTAAADFELEEHPPVSRLTLLDKRVMCDRIEIMPLLQSPLVVQQVDVDKVHYLPGETVRASAIVTASGAGGQAQLVAFDVTEADDQRLVFEQQVQVEAGAATTIEFEYPTGQVEFGHELRVDLRQGDTLLHRGRQFYGVSRNVYRVGITGSGGPQNKQRFTVEDAAKLAQTNKRNYANYFECFAWAPCDYSEMSPDDELFWSGQTQYPGSITGFKALLSEAHKAGVKGITYGKACAAGIEGYYTFQKHPEFFSHSPSWGPGIESLNTFYLERMRYGEFNLLDTGGVRGWQHWASLWCRMDSDATVDYGADEVIRSAQQFGWDGIRWDGHFIGKMARFKERVNAVLPNFVHGYNIAFANPGQSMFLPPADAVEDFHEAARGHGLMMDESARDWSNTNFSSGHIRPFYVALTREADYEKRIGGLPLYIIFDMGTAQDKAFNILCGLVAGQRYTYATTPGDFTFGPMPKWLTRYSAFVWDDTALLKNPDDYLAVTVAGQPATVESGPWYRKSTWLRKLPNGHQQLLVNLLNPPVYKQFCNRVQTPPATLANLQLQVRVPANAKLVRALHVSPDLVEGHRDLQINSQDGQPTVALDQLRNWSIVALEFAPAAGELAYPAFELTTPVEDAAAVFAEADRKKAIAAEQAQKKAEAGIGESTQEQKKKAAPHFADFERAYNVDAETSAKLKKPADLHPRRNGVLDVHHSRGAFFWCNPVEQAMGLIGGGQFRTSYIDRVGFRLRGDGCMDDFPDQYESLLTNDILVLDNLQMVDLGSRRRAMIADYVANGGSLLYFGGYFNLSLGADRNTAIDPLLPIEIVKYDNTVRNDQGLKLEPADPSFFNPQLAWSDAPHAFVVDTSPLRENVKVLVTAGGHPAIVASTHGKGRVITVLMNPHGNPAENVLPYWQWRHWPHVLAACMNWLAQDYETQYTPRLPKPTLDPTKPSPEDLMLEAMDMSGSEFTKKMRAAIANMIDAETSRILLEVAIDNSGKIDDPELLPQIAEVAGQYVDASFAPLAEKLVNAQESFLRRAGYRVLGLAGNKETRFQIEKGLREQEPENVREALIALGRLGDPAAVPAIRIYLAKGSEKLLALTVLKQLGESDVLARALPAYVTGLQRRVALKAARISAYEVLHGGTSFKLTPAARRRATLDYKRQVEVEQAADFDVRLFQTAMLELNETEVKVLTEFLLQTESSYATSLAYSVFARLPAELAGRYRSQLKNAKLAELRNLAN